MANRFTYEIKKSGFNQTIIVFDDNTQIYSNNSPTLTEIDLVRIAKIALKNNYGPDVDQMVRVSNTSQTSVLTPPSSNTSIFISGSNPSNLNEAPSGSLSKEDVIQKNYEEAKKNIQLRKKENQDKIDTILKDPFKKQKEQLKKRKEARAKAKKRTKEEKRKARKNRAKAVFQNAKKTLVPILTLVLTNKALEILNQNNTIKKLVEDTNKIIEEANISNDPIKLNNARIVRDNAIKVIQNNEEKITKLSKQIETLSITLNIFNTIVNSISPPILSTPVPSPAPDVVTIPKETFRRRVYEPALRVLNALSSLLPIITTLLQKLIQILNDYKAQLLAVNGELETKLPPVPVTFGTADYGEYKGFKFALREEDNPRFVVRGNKRHYAVAINKQNVEQLKSEASFTLDPNDLIEQLKLVIDRQNLQG